MMNMICVLRIILLLVLIEFDIIGINNYVRTKKLILEFH